jgi:hypothetical protein
MVYNDFFVKKIILYINIPKISEVNILTSRYVCGRNDKYTQLNKKKERFLHGNY